MANVHESPAYDAGIYQLEATDPVMGGVNGVDNFQAKGLANRTAFLKAELDAVINAAGLAADNTTVAQLMSALQALYIENTEKGAARGVPTLNANSEVVQRQDGATIQNKTGHGLSVKRADGTWAITSSRLADGYDFAMWDDKLISGTIYCVLNPAGLPGWFNVEVTRHNNDINGNKWRQFRAIPYSYNHTIGHQIYTACIYRNGVWSGWCNQINEKNMMTTVTNANGTAIKFADGTMICTGSTSVTYPMKNIYGNASVVFAVAFIAAPSVTVNQNLTSNQTTQALAYNETPTTVTLAYVGVSTPHSARVQYTALGRWK